MADIRKRDGKKGVTYQVRYPNQSAKSGHSFKTFRTMKEARAFSENSQDWDSSTTTKSLSISDAVDLWIDICQKVGRDGREPVEKTTLFEYIRRAKIIKEYSWSTDLSNIRTQDVVKFRTWLLENKTRDLAKRTLSSLHSIFIEMKIQGYIDHDPVSGITIKFSGRHIKDEVQIPSDDEMRMILDATEKLLNKNDYMRSVWRRYRPMIYLAAFSGLRPSEFRGMSWEGVSDRCITVTQRADQFSVIGAVKSSAAHRTVYVPKLVTDMLFEWRKHCPERKNNLVFPTKNQTPMRLLNIHKSCWLPLLKEAGLTRIENGRVKPKYKLYSLRHYFASKLIESKKDAKYIQTMMGHSSIELTYNVYGHLIKGNDKQHMEQADEILEALIGKNMWQKCGESQVNI